MELEDHETSWARTRAARSGVRPETGRAGDGHLTRARSTRQNGEAGPPATPTRGAVQRHRVLDTAGTGAGDRVRRRSL